MRRRSERSCRPSRGAPLISSNKSRALLCWPSTTPPAWMPSPVWFCSVKKKSFPWWHSSSLLWVLSLRQHDGGAGGPGQPAGELERWQRRRGRGCCWNILLWIRPQCCQGHIKSTGRGCAPPPPPPLLHYSALIFTVLSFEKSLTDAPVALQDGMKMCMFMQNTLTRLLR